MFDKRQWATVFRLQLEKDNSIVPCDYVFIIIFTEMCFPAAASVRISADKMDVLARFIAVHNFKTRQ